MTSAIYASDMECLSVLREAGAVKSLAHSQQGRFVFGDPTALTMRFAPSVISSLFYGVPRDERSRPQPIR